MRRLTLAVQWIRIVVIVSVLAAGGCRDSGGEETTTTVPTAPPDTTTTTALGYAVPETINVAYVERVMAALDHLEGEAARRAAAMRHLDQEFFKYLVAIYNPKGFELEQQIWFQIANSDFNLLAAQPKDPETTVERLIYATRECVLFAAKRDFSPMFMEPDPAGPQSTSLSCRSPPTGIPVAGTRRLGSSTSTDTSGMEASRHRRPYACRDELVRSGCDVRVGAGPADERGSVSTQPCGRSTPCRRSTQQERARG